MAEPLLPHGLSSSLRQLMLSAEEAAPAAVERLAAFCEGEAKRNVGSGGAHGAGTPTPARLGGGPAVVTGDLRRSVTHVMVGSAQARVGPADIPHRAPAPGWTAPKATCGQIGKYVEDMGFPWLSPALDTTIEAANAAVDAALHIVRW